MNTALKAILILVLIAVATVVAVYVLGKYWAPIKPYSDQIAELANQGITYLKDPLNASVVGVSGGVLTATGGAAISKINTAKKETQNAIDYGKSQIAGLQDEKNQMFGQFSEVKEQLTAKEQELVELKNSASTSLSTIEEQKKEIERLRSQLDGLSKLNVDTLSNKISDELAVKNRVS